MLTKEKQHKRKKKMKQLTITMFMVFVFVVGFTISKVVLELPTAQELSYTKDLRSAVVKGEIHNDLSYEIWRRHH